MFDLVCQDPTFCITRDYAPAAEVAGMVRVLKGGQPVVADPEVAARLGVKVQVVASDNFVDLPAEGLRQTCVEGICVAFRVACADLTCSWQVAPLRAQGPLFLREIRLVAATPQALEAAKANVFVAVDERRRVALAALGEGGPAAPGVYTASKWPGDRRLKRGD